VTSVVNYNFFPKSGHDRISSQLHNECAQRTEREDITSNCCDVTCSVQIFAA